MIKANVKAMKKIEKVVVVHLGEGMNESDKKLLWKWFGSDIQIKPVHYAALLDEFEFKKQADIVICQKSVNNHARLILSQWPYETHMICVGKVSKEGEGIDYVEELGDLQYKKYLS